MDLCTPLYLEWPVCECPHCDGLIDVSSAGLKEVKIYRDENARLILEGRQKDQQLKEGYEERNQLREENEQQKLLLLARDERIKQIEAGAAQSGNDQKCAQPKYHPYYDNPNSPSSQDSFTAIKRKKERRKKPEDHKARAQKRTQGRVTLAQVNKTDTT